MNTIRQFLVYKLPDCQKVLDVETTPCMACMSAAKLPTEYHEVVLLGIGPQEDATGISVIYFRDGVMRQPDKTLKLKEGNLEVLAVSLSQEGLCRNL